MTVQALHSNYLEVRYRLGTSGILKKVNLGAPHATSRNRDSEGRGVRSPSQSHTGCRLRVAWGDCCREEVASSRVGMQQKAGLTEDSKVGPAIVKVVAPNTPEQLKVPGPPSSRPLRCPPSFGVCRSGPASPTIETSIGSSLGCSASAPGTRSLIGHCGT